MPYCSFPLCCKETAWKFESENAQSIWYSCEKCKEVYAVYKMMQPSLLQDARQRLVKAGEQILAEFPK